MRTLIKNATIVNDGKQFAGSIIIDGDIIADIVAAEQPDASFDKVIDASGCYVLPGVIDDHVHFREPGLTAKADIDSESCAAAAGGVTSYFDMPNTNPQTTTVEALEEKFEIASRKSHVNYSFFFGATNENVGSFGKLDVHRIPGIKLFMGSSTGNMLVDKSNTLEQIFKNAELPIMTHCESTEIINRNMAEAKAEYGDDPDVSMHMKIRSEEACVESTRLAVDLARKYNARLHVAHISTARELELFENEDNISAEATVGHLFFSNADHQTLGARIKINPAIKTTEDRSALRRAIADGRISVVGTDHAPHLLSEKQGGCAKATSGMPMIQFSLVTMLELVDEGVISLERLVELMCHNPAMLFEVRRRGFIRKGYKADLVIVRSGCPWTVTADTIISKCGWSPMEGHTYNWKVETTVCNGHIVYENGCVDKLYIGEPIEFR
ncbi:MAG: dihydroorotase [Prevotella sp.]|nr:dihydroorotase [Prevotella sp.]